MVDLNLHESVSARSRYEHLSGDRLQFLTRGRQCSALTIPACLPPQGFNSSSQLPTPYQSLGARGARTLASKLLLALFPGVPFFNYSLDDEAIQKLGAQRGDIEAALSARERATVKELDLCVFRPAGFLSLLHLVITGNVILRVPDRQGERAQAYRLDQFVVRRDATGNLLEFVIAESTDYASLPDSVRETLKGVPEFSRGDPQKLKMESRPVEIYTHAYWDASLNKWVVYQEVCGIRLEDTVGYYLKDDLPYLVLRFSHQPGEHYGRSYVEEYLGDLDSLEALSETLVEGSAAGARVVFLVNPAGVTSLKVVQKAKNGDVVAGKAEDVTVMQVQKSQDLQVAKAQAEEIANRLAYAFLLHSSIQRNGERVTAEEIRYMASELDDGLGGVYTLFSADFQLPLVRLLEHRMEKRLKVGKLPSTMVKPVVVTGLEAIGRGHDLANLKSFVKDVIGVLGPEVAVQYINPLELIARAAASYGIDTAGLIPTREEVAQKQQQQQMMAMVQNLGPDGIRAAGQMGNTALKASLEPPQIPQG